MGYSTRQSASAAAWELAARQHGVVAHWQLVGMGFSARAIRRRVEKGRLHPVMRGVYAVGRPELSRYGRWMAAVLSCGTGAALSHRSAAALWRIADDERGTIHVTLSASSGRSRPGLRIHRRPSLPATELAFHHRIPVTGVVRTLMDLATDLGRPALERAINEADRLDLIDPETLRAALSGRGGQPGVGILRNVLDRRTFRLTDSELERRFLRIARHAGLPPPLTRQRLHGFKVDFVWPEFKLVVETDGLRYHRTPAQQARDRIRDQAHTVAGWIPLRFTHGQVRFEPGHVERTLRTMVWQVGDRGAAP
ncbi:MAG: DUF559 domain-containing protein [Solirubrobacterales bacterium]